MAYIWFNLVLEAIGKRITYESISCLYGNSFVKDTAKIVNGYNPLVKNGGKPKSNIMDLAGQIKIIESSNKEEQQKAAEDKLGDLSWAEGLF